MHAAAPLDERSSEEMLRHDCVALAAFRYSLRRFLWWSDSSARSVGLTPQQHQCLLAISGLPDHQAPTISAIAERLQIVHHTAVELVDRLAANGLVTRVRSAADHREVLIHLTPAGKECLRPLVGQTLDALNEFGPDLMQALDNILSYVARKEWKA
jgi:DNA-binding MarR family transcriptional regulator